MDWRAYTFAWRDDQSDADLVPADGAEKEVRDGKQKRVWQFHSRSQCMSCHSNQSEYALAFLPEQLNRPGPDGRNQLVALTEAGFIRRAEQRRQAAPAVRRRLGRAGTKARRPDRRGPAAGGAGPGLPARQLRSLPFRPRRRVRPSAAAVLQSPVAEMKAVGVRPTRGDFGLPDARIIKPGDPCASTLYFRMAKFGRDRMPHIGSERPDEAGLELDRAMDRRDERGRGKDRTGARTAGRPARCWPARSRRCGWRGSSAAASWTPPSGTRCWPRRPKLPAGPIRDLFEGYLPSDERKGRKLGSNPRPRAILALEGDPGRGEKLFWSQAVHCGSCHQIGDRGTPVGPDLSTIGKLRLA